MAAFVSVSFLETLNKDIFRLESSLEAEISRTDLSLIKLFIDRKRKCHFGVNSFKVIILRRFAVDVRAIRVEKRKMFTKKILTIYYERILEETSNNLG